MKIKYTEEQINTAIDLRKKGKTIPEISEITGIKKPTLKKTFQKNKIKLDKEQYKKNISQSRWKNYQPESIFGFKTCSICKKKKELKEYNKCSNSKDGLLYSCKLCNIKKYKKDKEIIKNRVRKYREKNKNKIKIQNKKYYQKNKEKVKDRVSDWREKNHEKCLEYNKKWGKKNQWRKNHNLSYRRSKKKQATPNWLSSSDKQKILNIFKNCPKEYHVDHIIPINSSLVCGLHVPWNLQYLSESENTSKGNSFISMSGVCYQKKQRDKYLQEDIKNGFPTNTKPCDFTFKNEKFNTEHRYFIEKYEWLGTIGFNVKYVFTARWNGLLAGVILLSEPNAYTKNFEKKKQCLIQRGACSSWSPKNLNSKLIMKCLNWMVKNTEKRVFIGYSDLEAGEIGTIYQACNFEYLGQKYGSKKIYTLKNGKKVSSRYFTKTSSMKKWAKKLGIKWEKEWTKENGYQNTNAIPKDVFVKLKEYASKEMLKCKIEKAQPKAKYMFLLGKNKKETKQLRKNKNYTTYPYPKRN